MSNIPAARRALEYFMETRAHRLSNDDRATLTSVVRLMKRKKPAFVARRTLSPLSDTDKSKARLLRAGGMPLNEIARQLNTNIGRVSEAINP